MIFEVFSDGWVRLGGRLAPCALGRGGVVDAGAKREGDGATPAGVWPLRRVLWRADRRSAPSTALPLTAIAPHDGWCDAPGDGAYNRPVRRPHGASAEAMWREDGLYDLLAVLGHNDAPPVPGAGSAIFLHLAKSDFSPTEGCVALGSEDLSELLARATPGDALAVRLAPRAPDLRPARRVVRDGA
jgi:L,D-peptidoglycan transpeptidase YkuD (ErfK/YbiS/YcfS/YnhG family)